ncbi:hypothetical protein BU24DRAFT_482795, partial [Aaosphaeria arxii CBS 175.79]
DSVRKTLVHPEQSHRHPEQSHRHPEQSHRHPEQSHRHPEQSHRHPEQSLGTERLSFIAYSPLFTTQSSSPGAEHSATMRRGQYLNPHSHLSTTTYKPTTPECATTTKHFRPSLMDIIVTYTDIS